MSATVGAGYRFSTADLRPADAFDQYRAIFANGAEALREGDRFAAELVGAQFSRMVIHRRRLTGIRHIREGALVRRSDFSHFTLTLCLAGAVTCVSDDLVRTLRPGEIALLDMSRPGLIRIEEAQVVTVAVAREIVAAAGGEPRRFHGHVFAAGTAAALARYLASLTAASLPAPLTAVLTPEEMIADLLREALIPAATTPAARARARRLLTAQRIVEARIDDPDFGPEALARAMRMSRATLYRLFQPLGGVTRYLLDRRLNRFRRLLSDPGRQAGVAALVAEAGLVSASHASQAFLDRFGERPGGFARQAASWSPAEAATVAMSVWQDALR